MEQINSYLKFFKSFGLEKGQHIIVHSSFRNIKQAFPETRIETMIEALKETITENGSLIMPAFTYCYKKSKGDYQIFDRKNSKSRVGAVSEVFRNSENVIRTSSPTHSFSLWGKAARRIDKNKSPSSPLGKNSVLDWLTNQDNSFVLLLGVDFTALSYGHYLEEVAEVPWADISPWDYMNVEKIGVSKNGKQKLKNIPGCSKSFKNFENYLLEKGITVPFNYKNLTGYFISIQKLYNSGLKFFRKSTQELLCPRGTCQACDTRRKKLDW